MTRAAKEVSWTMLASTLDRHTSALKPRASARELEVHARLGVVFGMEKLSPLSTSTMTGSTSRVALVALSPKDAAPTLTMTSLPPVLALGTIF